MKKVTKMLCIVLSIVMCMQICASAYTYSFDTTKDGAEQEENVILKETVMLNGDDGVAAAKYGLGTSKAIKEEGRTSTIVWDDHKGAHKRVEFSGYPTNLLDYTHVQLKFYAPEAYNNKILLYFQARSGGYGHYIYDVKEAGWHDLTVRVSDLQLNTAGVDLSNINRTYLLAEGGWGLEGVKGAVFYIQDYRWYNDGSGNDRSGRIEQSWIDFYAPRAFSEETQKKTDDILKNSIVVHKNMPTVLNKGARGILSMGNGVARMETIGGVDMVPVKFFEKYLGANLVNESNRCVITIGSKSVSVTEGSVSYRGGQLSQTPSKLYGELYVPLCDILNIFGLTYTTLDKSYIIADKSLIDTIDMEYELSECVSQSFTDDNFTITDEDYAKAIANVKRIYVGEDNDMSDPLISGWVNGLAKAGEDLLKTINMDPDAVDLWSDISHSNLGVRCQAYATRITTMAKAWGAKGSKYYHSSEMLNAALYTLDWWTKNIYNENNPDFISTPGGWFYWNYGTGNELMPGMFILSDALPQEHISKYLEGIDWKNPSSVGGTMQDREIRATEDKRNVSGNKCWQMRIALWSAILQRQPERIRQEINVELRRLFEYTEHVKNGRFHESVPTSWNNEDNKNGGFYADGSYIDHMYYPYIAGYGLNYFGVMGTVFRSLKGTSMFPSDPIMHNQVDWVKNALAPVIWKNNTYWRTRGRAIAVNSGSASTSAAGFIESYIHMLDYVTGDDLEFLKSLIKTQGQFLNSYSIGSGATGPDRVLFREIMNDDSIKVLDGEDISKVFFNMAAVVHQRDDWRFYLTMNSTEIGYAEIYKYSGENWNGFHQSDGHTTLMTRDGEEYNGRYWQNVDPTKASGVTSVERPFDFITGSICYAGTHFVGGTTLDDKYTVAAMDFYGHNRGDVTREDNKTAAYYSDLSAHKGWFMFDDEIVCLGSGISTTDGYETITTIDNKRLEGMEEPKTSTEVPQFRAVSVSAIGDDGNIPENTTDYSFSTRWSYSGADGWILYDLGEVKDLGYLGIAFYAGNERRTKFKILTSTDNTSWTQHFSGESSGTTDELETYDVNKKARYVKLECAGNNLSPWNSISEVHFYPRRNDNQRPVNNKSPFIYGTDDVWVNGTLLEKNEFEKKKMGNVNYVQIENVGGYYFPEATDLTFDKYTKNEIAFVDFYQSHGVDPTGAKYAYAILPTMDKAQTESYIKNPRFTILKNEANIQSVRHNDLNITGTIFWEKGESDKLSADIPCVINMYEDDKTIRLAIADPSKLSDYANIKVKVPGLSLKGASSRVSVTKGNDGYQTISIDFTVSNDPAFKGESYKGSTYTVEFEKTGDTGSAIVPPVSDGGTSGGGGGSASGKDKDADVANGAGKAFSDLDAYSWAEGDILALMEKGVISKSENSLFRPGDAVKREEFVKMLVEALDIPMSEEESGFTDSTKDNWYEKYLSAAKASGIINGREDGSFGAGSSISRQDMAVMMMRALEILGISLMPEDEAEFSDKNDIAPYAVNAVARMQKNGILNGMGDGTFAPKMVANRAQAAVIIKRIMDTAEKEVKKDEKA